MNAVDFEYAIRKDVRNNPIVREVDRDRIREMWGWVAVGALFVVVLLFSALQHFKLIRYGYDIERMHAAQTHEERLNRQLRLELETLRSPDRIAHIATDQLHLVAPAPGSAIVIQRVTSAAPPAKGLVASR
jgi:cell division protein FtsL